jgi:hypothetical protein
MNRLLEFAEFAKEQVEEAGRNPDPSSRTAALDAANHAVGCIENYLRRTDPHQHKQFLLVKPDINGLATIDPTRFTESARQVLCELEVVAKIVTRKAT